MSTCTVNIKSLRFLIYLVEALSLDLSAIFSIPYGSRSTCLSRLATDLTLTLVDHPPVGQIRPLNMFWTPPGPPEDDPARPKSISRL